MGASILTPHLHDLTPSHSSLLRGGRATTSESHSLLLHLIALRAKGLNLYSQPPSIQNRGSQNRAGTSLHAPTSKPRDFRIPFFILQSLRMHCGRLGLCTHEIVIIGAVIGSSASPHFSHMSRNFNFFDYQFVPQLKAQLHSWLCVSDRLDIILDQLRPIVAFLEVKVIFRSPFDRFAAKGSRAWREIFSRDSELLREFLKERNSSPLCSLSLSTLRLNQTLTLTNLISLFRISSSAELSVIHQSQILITTIRPPGALFFDFDGRRSHFSASIRRTKAKEFSNDEVRSEVSNPNVFATEHALPFQDISSQPTETANVNHVECGELTSTCLENSECGEFKFRKKKEDNYQPPIPTRRPALFADGSRYGFHGNDEEYLAKDDYNSGLLESSCGMGYVRDGDSDLHTHNMESKMSKKVDTKTISAPCLSRMFKRVNESQAQFSMFLLMMARSSHKYRKGEMRLNHKPGLVDELVAHHLRVWGSKPLGGTFPFLNHQAA
ncbi:hypothetical protein VNO77_44262 [Canavalia gladiata]|uniref:Uncharacterized protein n=1 Tax=Canavalia gladiata TaxID=3824 RepID=A0AAN9JY76_CANGL